MSKQHSMHRRFRFRSFSKFCRKYVDRIMNCVSLFVINTRNCCVSINLMRSRRFPLVQKLVALLAIAILCFRNVQRSAVSNRALGKQNFSKVSGTQTPIEYMTLHMIDANFGYMSAYYDSRSNAVVVLGKVHIKWINSTHNIVRDAMCDFYSENQTFVRSVPMHHFTSYLFYCNLTANATIPRAVSLRLVHDSELKQPIAVRIPPIAQDRGKYIYLFSYISLHSLSEVNRRLHAAFTYAKPKQGCLATPRS